MRQKPAKWRTRDRRSSAKHSNRMYRHGDLHRTPEGTWEGRTPGRSHSSLSYIHALTPQTRHFSTVSTPFESHFSSFGTARFQMQDYRHHFEILYQRLRTRRVLLSCSNCSHTESLRLPQHRKSKYTCKWKVLSMLGKRRPTDSSCHFLQSCSLERRRQPKHPSERWEEQCREEQNKARTLVYLLNMSFINYT